MFGRVTAASSALRGARSMSALRAPTAAVPGHGRAAPTLFTPGPLSTSSAVRARMAVDFGSRDPAFVSIVHDVRQRLLAMAGVSQASGWECVLMQGSGTFGVESMLGSLIPPPPSDREAGPKLLVLSNGAYGRRMGQMAKILRIPASVVDVGELSAPTARTLESALQQSPDATHVAVVHHETTSGCLNPVEEIGERLQQLRPGTPFFVDSMSGFGAYGVDLERAGVTAIVSSANKCIEGVPGFSFVLARRAALEASRGFARSLSLDLVAQWDGLRTPPGQFRFTPPTHTLAAFHQALIEHEAEGGQPGRLARYSHNQRVLQDGMAKLGFKPILPPGLQGVVITTFLVPDDPKFHFDTFYNRLSAKGLLIYPGKLTEAPCFRIGSIGRLFEADMQEIVDACESVLAEMGVKLPVTQVAA